MLPEYGGTVYDAVRRLPGSAKVPENTLAFVVALLNMFDGAAIVRGVAPQRDIGAEQLTLLAAVLNEAYDS